MRSKTVLTQIAEGVHVHQSAFLQSNAGVVNGLDGVLLIDPGISGEELEGLATELSASGQTVVAGFSTHPHWDHLLWHAAFGDVPRYGTALCAATAAARLSGDLTAIAKAVGIPDDVPLDLIGRITGLPEGTTELPWEGPRVQIIQHSAHAAGHAALLIEESGVLFVGDMLSDVLVPVLNANAADPIEEYLDALALLEGLAGSVEVFVPGHGSVGGADQLLARIDQDRAYLHALREEQVVSDSRIGPAAKPGWEFVSALHASQVQRLADKKSPQ
ncbi:MAG: MBL fold metallo-hydrolase [Pseudolysinimonas sp.]|uniref:MBL fold metallo-hydrolase n=1 Tax=Pseudolysinimonas sp. TaxID=2680009 RepID=UPI003265D1D3